MTTSDLPAGFEDLQHLVADWALNTEEQRYLRLHTATIAELRAFYTPMLARLDDALDLLNQTPLDRYSPEEKNLMRLAITFAETAHPCDLNWQDVDFNNAFDWRGLQFRSISQAAYPEIA